ncbi:hypothetical protein C0584_04415 [Candidatus Parcubacteria bacterium]|nr:MAG: hypothetical protein C0584_04415 [Candidatus Parcubacteria bacterium]
MNKQGVKKLVSLKVLAQDNGLTISFLTEQIKLERLKFEKKSNTVYSSQAWLDEYRRDFTFFGYMVNKNFPETNKKEEKKIETGKIIQEDKETIDIEKEFVSKWNKEFKKINDDFNSLVTSSPKSKKSKNDFAKAHNIHSAIIASAILLLLSFYTVFLFPEAADSLTRKIDFLVRVPYEKINSLVLTKVIDEEASVAKKNTPSREELSNYIKEKSSSISYPSGSVIPVNENDIVLGEVAGIDEGFEDEESTINARGLALTFFTSLAEKQKNASLKLNDKLSSWIDSIKK